jgi:D-lyxose ketol-isomerase
MKRSEINNIMRQADAFMREHGFHLPPFAYWTPDTWATKGPEVSEIVDRQLGWDITDFGSGDYPHTGLFIFTIRNGDPADLARGAGKLYAEKILVVDVGQITPLHFHWRKTEDIINRGGGRLVIQLYNSTEEDGLAGTPVTVSLDGVQRTVPAGSTVVLTPGESITLPTRLYHAFWAEDSRVLVGEVSLVNDDNTDNRFYQPVGRFPTIDEDEPPLYLLCTEYPRYYHHQPARPQV